MKPLPSSDAPLLIRTDFSDDRGWHSIRTGVVSPFRLFRANLTFVDDRDYAGLGLDALIRLLRHGTEHSFAIIADRDAVSHPDHPLLLVNLAPDGAGGTTFRAPPGRIPEIETNLSLGNMDFEEFAEAADADGVFRGFPR